MGPSIHRPVATTLKRTGPSGRNEEPGENRLDRPRRTMTLVSRWRERKLPWGTAGTSPSWRYSEIRMTSSSSGIAGHAMTKRPVVVPLVLGPVSLRSGLWGQPLWRGAQARVAGTCPAGSVACGPLPALSSPRFLSADLESSPICTPGPRRPGQLGCDATAAVGEG